MHVSSYNKLYFLFSLTQIQILNNTLKVVNTHRSVTLYATKCEMINNTKRCILTAINTNATSLLPTMQCENSGIIRTVNEH